jgi:hypothetical protein
MQESFKIKKREEEGRDERKLKKGKEPEKVE